MCPFAINLSCREDGKEAEFVISIGSQNCRFGLISNLFFSDELEGRDGVLIYSCISSYLS